jgi:hypothetical protein
MPMRAAVRVSMPGGSLACLVAATIACAACPAALAAADWVRLSAGLPFSDVQLDDYQLSPDGRWAVYIHDAEVDDAGELWSVPVFGGVPGRISGLLPAGSSVAVDFKFTPDGATVVYRAPQDSLGVMELYSVPIRGGVATKLNGALAAGGNVTGFSVPTGGGAATVLNGALVPGGDVLDFNFRLTGDGQRVVYVADQQTDEVQELYSVPIAGGVVTKLNGALVAGGDVGIFQIAANSQRVVYRADQQADDVVELYSVPTAGGAATKLNGVLAANGDVILPPDQREQPARRLPCRSTDGRRLRAVQRPDRRRSGDQAQRCPGRGRRQPWCGDQPGQSARRLSGRSADGRRL